MPNKKHDEIRSRYLLYTGEIFEVKRRKAPNIGGEPFFSAEAL
jgi:predicted amino acid racemase